MTHRQAAKVDANQPHLVKIARKLGASVQILSAVGNGCPDLLLGVCGKNILVEVKDGTKSPSAQKLTKLQERWHFHWKGQKVIINSREGMIDLILKIRRENDISG
jgi:hypothetical protein